MNGKELEYKGYKTVIAHDENTDIYHGTIDGIDELVYFESHDPDQIEQKFHDAVDGYVAAKDEGAAEDVDTDAD